MKKIINFLAIVSCSTLGAALAHADSWGTMHEGAMQDGPMHEGYMRGQFEEKIFKEMDANNDGAVSRAEYDAYHAGHFKEMDANGDGNITVDEMKAEHRKILEKGKGRRFDEADANHDGVLTREEAEKMPRLAKRFNEMDANHDGKLTREEMDSAMEKWRNSRDAKKRSD